MRITILGAGSWGTTLAVLLRSNAHQVILWSFDSEQAQVMRLSRENKDFLPGILIPPDIDITSDLGYAVEKIEMLVTAIPTQYIRSAVQPIRHYKFQNTIIVNVSKGIENDSLMTVSEILLDAIPSLNRNRIATLSGPSFAEEVSRLIPTAVVAASSNIDTAKHARQIFMAPHFRVYSSQDIRGVELAGSIKNVMAIGAGIADGSGFGDNTKAAIMTRGIAELTRLGILMGAQPQTFNGLSGIGDLIVTCMSKHSRNRFVGEEIGKGKKLKEILSTMLMVAEGVATTRSVYDLGKKFGVELPIVNEVYKVLFEDKEPAAATSALMTREAKDEL